MQAVKRLPIGGKLRQLGFGYAAVYAGVDVPLLGGVGGIDVARYVEVVAVGLDFAFGHDAREFWDFAALGYAIDNALDVARLHMVVFALFDEVFGGVDHQNVVALALLAQDDDDGGNACAEKDVGRQSDDGVDMVVFD